jgi:hypothetical protein
MSSAAVARAKDFIVDRIVDQAERENAPLTEVEIRILGFAEPSASTGNKEVGAVFGHDFDDEAYEAKIAQLAKNVYERDLESGLKPDWDGHLDEIANEDMYLLVMLERAGIVKTTTSLFLPDWRMALGLVPALTFVALGIVVAFTPFGARLVPNLFLRLGILVILWTAPFLIGWLRRRSAGS